jgi:hypothetical protein
MMICGLSSLGKVKVVRLDEVIHRAMMSLDPAFAKGICVTPKFPCEGISKPETSPTAS